jgi:hypothetical protein
VLCLAVTEGGELLSGSGDTTIKRWRGTQCVATYKGHTDTVRWEGYSSLLHSNALQLPAAGQPSRPIP